MKKLFISVSPIALFVLLLLAIVSGAIEFVDDRDVHSMQAKQYCEMVAIWKAAAARGVPIDQRDGWPDYQQNYEEVCL